MAKFQRNSNRVTGSFEHEMLNDKDELIEVQVEYEAFFDPNYGADADGRRGICELSDLELRITWDNKNITDFVYTFLYGQFQTIDSIASEKAWEEYHAY